MNTVTERIPEDSVRVVVVDRGIVWVVGMKKEGTVIGEKEFVSYMYV